VTSGKNLENTIREVMQTYTIILHEKVKGRYCGKIAHKPLKKIEPLN
jgi:hypothetical protein